MPQDSSKDNQSSTSTGATLSAGEDMGKAKEALAQSAHQITDEVKHVAGEAADSVKKAATSQLDAGRDFAAEHLGTVADALRKTGDELRSKDSGLTDYVTKAANSVDYVSLYLQTRTLSQLIGDVEGFARREPAMFLGGAFVAGLFGGRFLKSSPRNRKPEAQPWKAPEGKSRPDALPAYAGQGAPRRESPSTLERANTAPYRAAEPLSSTPKAETTPKRDGWDTKSPEKPLDSGYATKPTTTAAPRTAGTNGSVTGPGAGGR